MGRLPLMPSRSYQASRPLFAENREHSEFPFTKRGSAFLVVFQGRSFAVIARHTLRGYGLDQALIPVHDGFPKFMESDGHWTPIGQDDCHDFALYHLTTIEDSGGWRETRAPIDESIVARAKATFSDGQPFTVSGYAGVGENLIDYDSQTIYDQRAVVDCDYSHPDGDYVHYLRVRQSGPIGDFGGFSGGLVAARTGDGLVPAGVMITGAASSSLIRFVDVDAIYQGLSNFLSQIVAE